MSLDHLYPFAGQHAIQSATFALDFSTELDVAEISRLRAAAVALKNDFPNLTDQHRTTFSFHPNQQDQSPSPATAVDIGGFSMERPSSTVGNQPLRLIGVSRENIVVIIQDYTRWDKFKSDVERYLSVLLQSINAQKGISGIGLQISDMFVWKADPLDLDLAEVFSSKTRYLVPNVFSPGTNPWHSHHGYLTDHTPARSFQQLDNVNVSKNLVSGETQLQVLTSHKVTFLRPLYKILDANRTRISEILDTLHGTNKSILSDLLTPEVQSMINLNVP